MNYSIVKGKRFISAILCLVMLMWMIPVSGENAEDESQEREFTIDDCYVYLNGDDGNGELVPLHTVTSVGRENVKLHGVKSKNKLLEYTIPDELLLSDGNFAALMMEADKYIGFPYVYGASNPHEGFDCSGFVSWAGTHFQHHPVVAFQPVGISGHIGTRSHKTHFADQHIPQFRQFV